MHHVQGVITVQWPLLRLRPQYSKGEFTMEGDDQEIDV